MAKTDKYVADMAIESQLSFKLLSVCPGLITFLYFFVLHVLIGVLLQEMVESCLPSKDEPLNPNIDEVMAIWIFRRRAQNTKIGENWTS